METYYTLVLRFEGDGQRQEKTFPTVIEARDYSVKQPAAECTLYSETDNGSKHIDTFRN